MLFLEYVDQRGIMRIFELDEFIQMRKSAEWFILQEEWI